ncbi:myoneurin-like [Wyeomyia smithii]|uniref:myoneurin-like n=1 Tax=Wyeomyia smithii TaxID=174621 RepID=UPI002467FDE4|nr:myoneurin-like [Wyeomyia smithii]
MVVFSLERFPDVCWICFKPNTARKKMISLDTKDELFDGTIREFLAAVTFIIPEDNNNLMPQLICAGCLDPLKEFARFRTKLNTTNLLISALVELKLRNERPIRDLFKHRGTQLGILIKNLQLCSTEKIKLKDLLAEFSLYDIASLTENGNDEKLTDFNKFKACTELVTADDLPQINELVCDEDHDTNEGAAKEAQIEVKRKNRKSTNKQAANKRTCKIAKRKSTDLDSTSSMDSIATGAVNPPAKCADKNGTIEADPPAKRVKKPYSPKTDPPLKCSECSFATRYDTVFIKHQATHDNPKDTTDAQIYFCRSAGCAKSFSCRQIRFRHFHQAHCPFVCEICGKRCATQTELKYHVERHKKQHSYNCRYCKKTYNTKIDLNLHIRFSHNAQRNYPCEICGLSFRRKDILRSHLRHHKDVYEYPCKMCDKRYKTDSDLRKHRMTIHDGLRVPCEYCTAAFENRGKMFDHVEHIHGIQVRFVCDICVLPLEGQDKLDQHKLRHTNPQECECGTCLEVFSTAELMASHVCITYIDDYVCCNRDHRNHQFYNKHMFIKHGKKSNARVKPIPGQLLGTIRATRKRIQMCRKCETVFPNRAQRMKHVENCIGPTESTTPAEAASFDSSLESDAQNLTPTPVEHTVNSQITSTISSNTTEATGFDMRSAQNPTTAPVSQLVDFQIESICSDLTNATSFHTRSTQNPTSGPMEQLIDSQIESLINSNIATVNSFDMSTAQNATSIESVISSNLADATSFDMSSVYVLQNPMCVQENEQINNFFDTNECIQLPNFTSFNVDFGYTENQMLVQQMNQPAICVGLPEGSQVVNTLSFNTVIDYSAKEPVLYFTDY